MTFENNADIEMLIKQVIEFGSHYQTDRLAVLYAEDKATTFVSGRGHCRCISRSELLAEFEERRATGDLPLSTEHRVLHITQESDRATAVLYWRVCPETLPTLCELQFRKGVRGWEVSNETILAFPGAEDAESFLPKRHPFA